MWRFLAGVSKRVLSIISIILTPPVSTSENENENSLMKITKTDRRSKMKTSTLGDLLTIQLCTPSVRDYNPDAAIEAWMRAVNTPRRPTFKDGMTPRSGSLGEVPNQGELRTWK